ncbi:MAG: transglycosylase SLT domain-containing protein [Pseudomonadales bacterium]|nr:transglycosylase SLT domain-containing protein [Pseudomonadales bacterium]
MIKRIWLRAGVILLVLFAVSSVASSWVVEKEDDLRPRAKGGEQDINPGQPEFVRDQEQYRTNLRRYIGQIKSHWGRAEVSDATTWVVYSDTWLVKRVVDFKANEVRVTLPRVEKNGRIDFIKTNAAVKAELVELLLTDMQSAYEEDPISTTIPRDIKGDRKYLASLGDDLVLSELFAAERPSSRDVERLAAKLMLSALITYQQNLAALSSGPSNLSLPPVIDSEKHNIRVNSVMPSVSVPVTLNKKLTYTVPLPKDRLRKKAKELKSTVTHYAAQHNVPPDVLFAIIHTESHFNPLARSPVPAYGLMQIVPSTAGRDASRVLFDKSKRFSASYLYNPKNNIELGAAYLNLIYYQYLGGIGKPKSRLYCAIAAYNTGAANVAKAFIRKPQMNKAIPQINKMSDDEVLERLLEGLSAKETREYLKKVLSRRALYKNV